MNDFAPTATWEILERRARLLRQVREFFDQRGFLEVETPLLSHDTVVDRHLEPFAVPGEFAPPADQQPQSLWLQTSPEFGMKRLLAAGAQAIYQITRAFRRDERGALHNPEFTIVEWYRAGDAMAAGIELLADLTATLLRCDSVRRARYRDAFLEHAGIDPLAATAAELEQAARRLKVTIPMGFERMDRDDWLDLLLVERVSHPLSAAAPVILFDYPASQAMLARVRPEPPAVAERFELFYRGIELANGYHELVDPDELRRRNRLVNEQRVAEGKASLPCESRLLAAMDSGLPPCTGVALGFDRLLMLMTGAEDIAQVIAFPIERA